MIDFDQPIKDNKVTYENIGKSTTGQGDDYSLRVVRQTISILKIITK